MFTAHLWIGLYFLQNKRTLRLHRPHCSGLWIQASAPATAYDVPPDKCPYTQRWWLKRSPWTLIHEDALARAGRDSELVVAENLKWKDRKTSKCQQWWSSQYLHRSCLSPALAHPCVTGLVSGTGVLGRGAGEAAPKRLMLSHCILGITHHFGLSPKLSLQLTFPLQLHVSTISEEKIWEKYFHSITQLCKLFVHRDVLEGKSTIGKGACGMIYPPSENRYYNIFCALLTQTQNSDTRLQDPGLLANTTTLWVGMRFNSSILLPGQEGDELKWWRNSTEIKGRKGFSCKLCQRQWAKVDKGGKQANKLKKTWRESQDNARMDSKLKRMVYKKRG